VVVNDVTLNFGLLFKLIVVARDTII